MTVTSEDVQRGFRIVLYLIGGALIQRGLITDATWGFWSGTILTIANLAWTMYGMRLVAKINEIAKFTEVTKVIVTNDSQLASDAPSTKVHV